MDMIDFSKSEFVCIFVNTFLWLGTDQNDIVIALSNIKKTVNRANDI